MIISDYNAIAELIVHGVAADLSEAAALALRAGVDIDMMGGAYIKGLEGAVSRGLVSMAEVDAAVIRVLTLKMRLGLFDDPFRGIASDHPSDVRFRPLAREAARKSVVLLKNANSALPLPASGGLLAVMGPLADSQADMLGPWSGAGRAEDCVTFLVGIEQAFPGRRILYAPGTGIPEAVTVARQAEAVILCVGESRNMSGEASCRGEPALPEAQAELATALIETGKPVILVLSSGRPIVLPPEIIEGAVAILATWFLGSEGGSALGDILSGAAAPVARLPVTWPASAGQIPIYYAERRSGRPADPAQRYSSKYLDIPVEPLLPFGHGLTYTQFEIGTPAVSSQTVKPGDSIEVTVDAVNTGTRAGATTLFLFIHDPVASVAQPIMLLKRFAKVEAGPGERVTARFTLSTDDLAFTGADLRPRVENGRIDILIGERAVESKLKRATIEITGAQPHLSPRSKEQLSSRS